jgi:hypothetical protein
MQRKKKVERVGFEQLSFLSIAAATFRLDVELSLKRAEVVGSTPTRSISYYEGTTALN